VGLTSQEERGQVAIPIDNLITGEWEVVGSKGDSHANYDELLPLVARGKRTRRGSSRARSRSGT